MSTALERLATALSDRYRIESEIGSGGMAHVYRARDLKHGRDVALKVLRPELAYAVGADRFIREINATAKLRHPHILPLYDSGEVEGALYYVMPLIDGETLRARIDREGPLPVDESLRITREVADALGYARRLIEQEPTTAQWRSDLAWGLWSSGNGKEALESARAGAAVDSSFYEVFDIMSLILADAGNFAAADSAHERAVKVAGGDYWVRVFDEGLIAHRRGDTSGVRRALSQLDGDPRLAQRGGLLLLLGQQDSAYAMLNRAVEARDVDLLQVLNAMPALYPFRHEPRYQELMAKIGMPERLRR